VTFTHNGSWAFLDEGKRTPLEGTGGHFWTISIERAILSGSPVIMVTFGWRKRLAPWFLLCAVGFASA
jgi:hypothetical protein